MRDEFTNWLFSLLLILIALRDSIELVQKSILTPFLLCLLMRDSCDPIRCRLWDDAGDDIINSRSELLAAPVNLMKLSTSFIRLDDDAFNWSSGREALVFLKLGATMPENDGLLSKSGICEVLLLFRALIAAVIELLSV